NIKYSQHTMAEASSVPPTPSTPSVSKVALLEPSRGEEDANWCSIGSQRLCCRRWQSMDRRRGEYYPESTDTGMLTPYRKFICSRCAFKNYHIKRSQATWRKRNSLAVCTTTSYPTGAIAESETTLYLLILPTSLLRALLKL